MTNLAGTTVTSTPDLKLFSKISRIRNAPPPPPTTLSSLALRKTARSESYPQSKDAQTSMLGSYDPEWALAITLRHRMSGISNAEHGTKHTVQLLFEVQARSPRYSFRAAIYACRIDWTVPVAPLCSPTRRDHTGGRCL